MELGGVEPILGEISGFGIRIKRNPIRLLNRPTEQNGLHIILPFHCNDSYRSLLKKISLTRVQLHKGTG